MRSVLASALLILTSCSSDKIVGSEPLGKAVDVDALGGLLKGRWININVQWTSGIGSQQVTDYWILEIDDAPGEPDLLKYNLIRVFDTELFYHITAEDLGLGSGVIEDNLVWEQIETGTIRPVDDNGKGHILFDRRYNIPTNYVAMGFRIDTGNRIVVWDKTLKIQWWDGFGYDLDNRLCAHCDAAPDHILCTLEFE